MTTTARTPRTPTHTPALKMPLTSSQAVSCSERSASAVIVRVLRGFTGDLLWHGGCRKRASERGSFSEAKSRFARDEAHSRGDSERVAQRDSRAARSEERRVGKECRSRWSPDH